jgi:hypothetical protein
MIYCTKPNSCEVSHQHPFQIIARHPCSQHLMPHTHALFQKLLMHRTEKKYIIFIYYSNMQSNEVYRYT